MTDARRKQIVTAANENVPAFSLKSKGLPRDIADKLLFEFAAEWSDSNPPATSDDEVRHFRPVKEKK